MDCVNKDDDTFPCNILAKLLHSKVLKVRFLFPLTFSVEKLFHSVENDKKYYGNLYNIGVY